MRKEVVILIICWMISLCLLFFFIPIEKRRYAQITFIFAQAVAWIYVYIQVLFGLLEFPFREFTYATKMSFSMHYIVYPTVAVFFMHIYPEGKGWKRILLHYLIFSMFVPTFTFILEKYSSLFYYVKWSWYLGVLVNLIIFNIHKKFAFWFKKGLI
jgi:hypothetical protein